MVSDETESSLKRGGGRGLNLSESDPCWSHLGVAGHILKEIGRSRAQCVKISQRMYFFNGK